MTETRNARIRRTVAAAALLLVATPVAAWWLVGDISEVSGDVDYAIRPADISPGTETAIGAAATAVALVALTVLLLPTSALRRWPRWWSVLAPLAALGVFAGWGWRVMTAGVIGANIGAGRLVLLAPCLTLAVAASCGLRARRLLAATRGAHRS